ncbi:hypothetical protein RSAG8_09040, partial [Rhizoctonia solani AG-8 WAC10335]
MAMYSFSKGRLSESSGANPGLGHCKVVIKAPFWTLNGTRALNPRTYASSVLSLH